MTTFTDLVRNKGIKHNQAYCYELEYGKSKLWKYSEKLIEHIKGGVYKDEKKRRLFMHFYVNNSQIPIDLNTNKAYTVPTETLGGMLLGAENNKIPD